MTVPLGERCSPDVPVDRLTVAVPVGSVEQHGPHLPLDTDTRIAEAVARGLTGCVVAPALNYGASGEHQDFPGTISIGLEALETVLVEYGRSVSNWANRSVFVNGHGGNARALANAVRRLRFEGRDAVWLACATSGADGHAGRFETSLMLHLAPHSVRTDRAEAGNTTALSRLMPELRAGGIRAVSANGVLGDPRSASAEEGNRYLDEMVSNADALIAEWAPDADGRLVGPHSGR